MNNRPIYILKLLVGIIILAFLSVLLINGGGCDLRPVNFSLLLIINIVSLYQVRKNIFFAIVIGIITYCNYSIIFPNYVTHLDNFFTQQINYSTTNISINILTLFNLLLYIVLPKASVYAGNFNVSLKSQKEFGPIFEIGVIFLLIIILIFGYKRPTEIGVRSDPSPTYEYSVILFILAFYFTHNRLRRRFLFLLCLVFSLQNFIFGGRITGLQYLCCLYIFFFSDKVSLNKLVIIALPIFFFMTLIGAVRGAILSGSHSFESIFNYILKSAGALDTAYSAYYTSEIFVYAESEITDNINYLIAFLAAIFIGYKSFPTYLLQNVADRFYQNYAGGIYPYYFYFFANWIGVVFSVLIVGAYLNALKYLNKSGHDLVKCIGVFFICHTFRWYLYTPYSLLRGTLILCVLYFIVRLLFTNSRLLFTHEKVIAD